MDDASYRASLWCSRACRTSSPPFCLVVAASSRAADSESGSTEGSNGALPGDTKNSRLGVWPLARQAGVYTYQHSLFPRNSPHRHGDLTSWDDTAMVPTTSSSLRGSGG